MRSHAAGGGKHSSNSNKFIFLIIQRLILASILFVLAFCLYFGIGEELERQAWLKAPSTLSLYTTDEVCFANDNNIANDDDDDDDGKDHILNCGHCGSCSNVHDIRIYKETAQTLTGTMTWCAFEGYFLGKARTLDCLQKASNLSTDCAHCWVENAECNKRHCRTTCLHYKVFPFLPTTTIGSWKDPRLDPCITCDERFCGPGFVACSGANRRRVGVVSDLQRDMNLEMCDKTDWPYVMKKSSSSSSSEEVVDATADADATTTDARALLEQTAAVIPNDENEDEEDEPQCNESTTTAANNNNE
mmetsp:Transcript_8890/g.11834  ORF Transcript_8890/g.11834 Transcript_8890/m.11834 type:complete len:303 (-) Transcript_8890:55-963(-)